MKKSERRKMWPRREWGEEGGDNDNDNVNLDMTVHSLDSRPRWVNFV